ncbi:hypothetical protein [uncultured Microbulbifer sp.]|uniref:hypothetical protein n=1 Tax=uncultured Microbulbifer sp. TaxID=348147 RepID=UPI00261CC2EF|nr:hypothetical protein [uncultured Microbulbifer sp.]
MAEIVVLAAAGMGAVRRDFAKPLFSALQSALGDDWLRLHCDSLPGVEAIHNNIERVFESMQKRDLDGLRARKFLLYGMAQSTAQLEDIQQRDGIYERGQSAIYAALQRAAAIAGDRAPVVLLSHSVGCITLSNYLWDAQRSSVNHGIWRDGAPSGVRRGSSRERFLRLKTLSHWYTLGATNPLWCSGKAREQIQAVTSNSRGYLFRWKNFYHPDDLFGWPLKPLSPTYKQAVYRDYETNPLSDHRASGAGPQVLPPEDYWCSERVQEELIGDLRALLKSGNQGASVHTERSREALAV